MTAAGDGIGLLGREPVGAVLTIGHKDKARGFPTDTDRFFIVVPQEEDGIRANHPAFAKYNELAPEHRRTIRGVIVHASPDRAYNLQLRNQQGPVAIVGKNEKGGPKQHPQKRPFCTSRDGKNAERWMGGDANNFVKIPCPNRLCEFRKAVGDSPVPCKPEAKFLFRPTWKDGFPLPAPLMKLVTHSWNSSDALEGFFRYIDENAKQLGVPNYTLYGLQFVITLAKKKRQGDAGTARSFPVLSISPDCDLQHFLFTQQDREQLYARPVAALTDAQTPEEDYADYKSVVPGLSRDDDDQPPSTTPKRDGWAR